MPTKCLSSMVPALLRECIETATPYPIAGLFEVSDFAGSVDRMYEKGLPPGAKPGWPSLNQLSTFQPGQWTVVTGIPGNGKSELLDAILINLATAYGSKSCSVRLNGEVKELKAGETTYTINGVTAVKVNYHHAIGIGEIADILEDAAKDLRKELESRNQVQYDACTVSLTVPATYVNQHFTNQMNAQTDKFFFAMEDGNMEAAEKYWALGGKFYEYIRRNHTPEAIKNSQVLQQQAKRIQAFKGIRVPLHEDIASTNTSQPPEEEKTP